MPAQIRPTRLDVTDRFPMVGFRIRADGGPSQAEVAIAVDPALFAPDRKKDRTAANFYSTRGNGGVRFQGAEAGYTVPPEILARFIGNDKLYFGLATAGDGGAMKVAVMPNTTSPYISIKGLSGRSMSRVRVLPNRQQRAAGYKRASQEQLDWAGDVAVPGMEPLANGAAPGSAPSVAAPNGAAGPAHYDDGFGPLPDTSAPTPAPAPAPAQPAAQSLAARGIGYPPVRALSDEPFTLTPPEVGTLGWVARKAAEVAIGMAPGGVGVLLNAAIALANSYGCSVGVGPQVGGGLGAGGAAGAGVIFGKDGDLGIYGSLEIDIGFITSISATACVTIVQGGIDAFNGWNYGFAISGGEGIVSGAMILLNDKSEFVGASANVGIGAGFSPVDFYVAAQHGWATRVQSLALAYAQGLSAPGRTRGRVPVQARRYSNGSGVGYARAQGGGARALDAGSTTLDIRYRCFIPSPLIDSPFTVYGGDGRGFQENGGTSRGDLHARVTLMPGGGIESISTIDRHWGESSEYATSDSYHVEGKPDWWLGKVDGAQPTNWDTLQADDDNLNIVAGSTGSTRNIEAMADNASIVSITAIGSLPLSLVAPAIDADLAIMIRRTSSGGIECKVVGEHDGFPCHEVYVNGVAVYTFDPVAAGEGPTALKPPMDITARTDWIDCTGSGAMAQSLGAGSWTVNWDEVELVPQPTEFSCWAAAGAMLVGWRDRVSLTPDSVAASCSRSTASGLLTDDNSKFAAEMGFSAEAPVCYTEEGFRDLIARSGPLWVSEGVPPNLHAIIVTGMYSDGTNSYVRIADPWDRTVGTPGVPGNYATTHNTGSRYIMSWADFTQQYEAAMTGEPPNRQILHSGNPKGLSPNTGQTVPPPGYAQSLGRARTRKMPAARGLSGEQSFTINWDDVQQIAQPTDLSCWATSASMVLGWRDKQSIDINYIAGKAGLTTATGLDPAQVGQFATDMDMVAEPPQSYTIEAFRQLIAKNGPLWVGEANPGLHVIVVTGLYSDGSETYVRITDPWDREIGLPGKPGIYADTHAAGSRYIMRWADFVAEYEKAATDFARVNLQILHCGGTFGNVANTGGSTPSGYAQGLGTVVPSYSANDPRGILTQIFDFFGRFGEWTTGVDVTRSMPHSAICQLQITQTDGSLAGGTAFYAGPGLIVTCAHCLVDAQSVRVFAGRTDGDFLTMFDVDPADWSIHPHFVSTDDPYDIAVIRVQWAGGMAPNGNHFEMQDLQGGVGSKIIVSGYAGDNVNINRQHMDGSTIHELSPDGHHVFYNLQTAAGESGAPVLALVTGSDQDGWADAVRVVGVHVDSHSLTRNMGVRLTPEKISWILNRGMVAPAAYGLDAIGGPIDTAPTDADLTLAPPPPPRARALDVLGTVTTIGGILPQILSDSSGDISWELDQFKGLKHPNDKAPANPASFTDAATIRLDDWPKLTGWYVDDIFAWFTVDWQHNGLSLGNVRIGNIATNDAKLMKLKVRAQIMDDNILYEPGGLAALRVRFHYRFSRTPGDDVIGVTELQLFADGTYLRKSDWLQKSTI
jgi:Papain-like cysteine protease AvrRpt2/Trypsin-like peptidase domain/Protein of unknown function (DUF3238)